MSTIICGSRRYENINFDKIVDSFETIVRTNMLLPNNNYGTKNSDIQAFNVNINMFYEQKTPVNEMIETIGSPLWKETLDIPEEHTRSFFNYMQLDSVRFKYFKNNNTDLMIFLLKKHGINHAITKQLRCGLAYVAESIKLNIKPYLIGFSVDSSYALNKQYSGKESKGSCHDINSDINLIIKLHNAELVDATFCAIKDCEDLTIDSSIITPTQNSLDILRKVYNDQFTF